MLRMEKSKSIYKVETNQELESDESHSSDRNIFVDYLEEPTPNSMNKFNDQQQTPIRGINMTPKPTPKPFNPPNVVLTSTKRRSGASKRKAESKQDSDYSSKNSEANKSSDGSYNYIDLDRESEELRLKNIHSTKR